MIQVSNTVKEALARDSRTFLCKLLINGTTDVAGSVRALKVNKGSCGAEEFKIGAVYVPYITATIDYEGETMDSLNGVELLVQIGINTGTLDSPLYEYMNIGYFTVTKPQVQGSLVYITAYGRLTNLTTMYTTDSTQTLTQVLDTIKTNTGLDYTVIGDIDMTGTVSGLSGWTYLEVLQIIAGLVGGYVTEDNNGGFVLVRYNEYTNIAQFGINEDLMTVPPYTAVDGDGGFSLSSSNWQITSVGVGGFSIVFGEVETGTADIYNANTNDFQILPTLLDAESEITGITCYKSIAVGDEYNEKFTYGDGLYEYANEYMTQSMFTAMASSLGGWTYRAGTLNMSHGTPILEPWDAVKVVAGGQNFILPCMSIEIIFDGGIACNVVSVGRTATDEETHPQGALSQRVARTLAVAQEANDTAYEAKGIADNTAQYFWYNSTGSDTGVHITEIPSADFLQTPSGGNLLGRSNGIAVRNGLTELAIFGANESRVGLANSSSVSTKSDGVRFFDGAGNNCAFFGIDGGNPSIRVGKTDQRGHIRITPTSGVRFLREDDSTPMAQLASDGLQIWSNDGTNNISSAFFGAECRVGASADKNIYVGNGSINFRDNGTSLGELTGTTARIGKTSSKYIYITSSAINFNDNGTDIGYIGGSSARIGATSGKNIYITSTAVNFQDNGNDIGYISGTSARLGSPNSEGNITFDTTNGFRVWNAGQTASYAQIKSDYGRIGAFASGHTVMQSSGIDFYGGDGSINLAHIGYASGNAQSGTAVAPYYTFGTRATGTIGNYSTAEGYGNIASGYCSHAEGNEAIASGHYSHAEGILLSTPSMPSGVHPTASGYASHTEGGATTASGNYSHAEGQITVASNTGSHAEGSGATASGFYSHAEGQNTTASGTASHAGGANTIANGNDQTAIGKYNVADTTSAFLIGNGTGNSARSNALSVDWNGNVVASGTLTLEGHSTAIGWYDAHYNTIQSLASGTSYAKLDASKITLSAGRYVVTGTASYQGNTSGYRAVGFCTVVNNTESAIYESRQITPTIPSTSWRTYVSTSHIITVTEDTDIYLTLMQNSGSPLSTDWYIKAMRIR